MIYLFIIFIHTDTYKIQKPYVIIKLIRPIREKVSTQLKMCWIVFHGRASRENHFTLRDFAFPLPSLDPLKKGGEGNFTPVSSGNLVRLDDTQTHGRSFTITLIWLLFCNFYRVHPRLKNKMFIFKATFSFVGDLWSVWTVLRWVLIGPGCGGLWPGWLSSGGKQWT